MWYAVQKNSNDDWGTGSFDFNEAAAMLKELYWDGYPHALIACIDNGVCVNEVPLEEVMPF